MKDTAHDFPISQFRTALARILAKSGGAAGGGIVVVALSGGMDSVVVAHLLGRCRDLFPAATRFVAAHLNHGLRAEAGGDQEFCRGYAEGLGFSFVTRTVDIAAVARAENLGIEEAGRIARYRFFYEICGENGLVITGHHADDQAETILMNLRRGAHRRGLSGMNEFSAVPVPPGVRVRIGRPLLVLDRAALQQYAVAHSLVWRVDASNADDAFTRNRIRNKIIPMLEAILPGFKYRLLLRAADLARQEAALAIAGGVFAVKNSRREANGRFLKIAAGETLGGAASQEVFLYALRHIVEEELGGRLPYGAVLTRLSELAESGRVNETLSLPGRLRVRRERDGLFFFFADRGVEDMYAEVVLPDPPFRITAYGLEISASWEISSGRPPAEDRADPGVEWLNPAAIRWPLRLRAPHEGERFRPLGAPGSRSRRVHDILVDAKIPRRRRGLPRVLADYAGVVWVWPLRLAHRVRLPDSSSRALRVTIKDRGAQGIL